MARPEPFRLFLCAESIQVLAKKVRDKGVLAFWMRVLAFWKRVLLLLRTNFFILEGFSGFTLKPVDFCLSSFPQKMFIVSLKTQKKSLTHHRLDRYKIHIDHASVLNSALPWVTTRPWCGLPPTRLGAGWPSTGTGSGSPSSTPATTDPQATTSTARCTNRGRRAQNAHQEHPAPSSSLACVVSYTHYGQ